MGNVPNNRTLTQLHSYATVLMCDYFELPYSTRRDVYVEDDPYIEYDDDKLLDEPICKLDDLQSSVSDDMKDSVQSPFDDIETSCAAGIFRVQTDFMMIFLARAKVYKKLLARGLVTLHGRQPCQKRGAPSHASLLFTLRGMSFCDMLLY